MQARDAGGRETCPIPAIDGNRWPAGDQLMMPKARGERCGEKTRIREERKERTKTVVVPAVAVPPSGPTFYPTVFCRSVISCGQVLFVLQYIFLSKSPSLSASCPRWLYSTRVDIPRSLA
jgi:hypothetical protein